MIDSRLLTADQLGIRLEVVNGLSIWEAQPLYKHQKAVERIAQSISRIDENCACVHAMDVYVQFPNGLKRPDISIFLPGADGSGAGKCLDFDTRSGD